MSYPHITEPITLWAIVNPSGHIRHGYEHHESHAWNASISGRTRPDVSAELIDAYKAAGWRAVKLSCTPPGQP